MAIDYPAILSFTDNDQRFAYTDREVMLYALGLGWGRDPLDASELPFVYERALKVLPSFASVMAHGCFKVRALGINYARVLHGEFSVELNRPLPPAAALRVNVCVPGIWDKGAAKGAVLQLQAEVLDAADNAPLCTIRSGYFCRGDGGFLPDGTEQPAAPAPHPIPGRPPDLRHDTPTRTDQALLYRLSGDRNPLHGDPEVARAAGFPRPILHGLCTYGICCSAIVRTLCDFDPQRIRSLRVRFSQPVYPGETIVTEMWRDGDTVSFRARVRERDVIVIDHGCCELWS
jgi:acyl dehydratase